MPGGIKMNYFEELNKFWRTGITNYLTPNASLLYLCLLDIANSRHWPQRFAVKAFVLEESTGIAKRNTLIDARNRLSQVGLIRFSSTKGSKLTHYEVLGVDHALTMIENFASTLPKNEKVSVNVPGGFREVSVRLPEGETLESSEDKAQRDHQNKHNDINDTDDRARVNFVTTYEQEFGRLISPTELERLKAYIGDGLSEELVSEAIKRTREQGKANIKYAYSILNDWRNRGITNMAGVALADQEFEQRKARGDPKKRPRGETSGDLSRSTGDEDGNRRKDLIKKLYLT
jgi:DnaD/phage-associated family protein